MSFIGRARASGPLYLEQTLLRLFLALFYIPLVFAQIENLVKFARF